MGKGTGVQFRPIRALSLQRRYASAHGPNGPANLGRDPRLLGHSMAKLGDARKRQIAIAGDYFARPQSGFNCTVVNVERDADFARAYRVPEITCDLCPATRSHSTDYFGSEPHRTFGTGRAGLE